jgi:outer membrane protein TolC
MIVTLAVAAPAAARQYTLPELIAKVNATYSGVQAARSGVDSAEAQLSQAARLAWPTGQLTFGITGSPEIRCVDPVTGQAWNVKNTGGDQARAVANCVRTDVVDLRSGDQVLPGVDVARAQVDKDRQEVTFNVTRAYWLLKWSRAASAVLDDVIERLKGWIKKIDKDIDAGKTTYTENDLVRMKLALDTAELSQLDVDKGRELGLAGLRMLVDEPDADIDDSELDIAQPDLPPLDFYEDAATLHRPEARMLSAGIRAARASRRLQLANLMPDVGLALSFTYAYASAVDDPQNAFMNHPNALGAGLALVIRYNLDVPERLATHNKAIADQHQIEARRRQALGGIQIEIENAWLEARAARRKAELLGHSEKVARGWYNAVDENLQVGVAESRDLVDAARNFFELRMRHLQSIMDVNMATASLKQAAGVLVDMK